MTALETSANELTPLRSLVSVLSPENSAKERCGLKVILLPVLLSLSASISLLPNSANGLERALLQTETAVENCAASPD